MFCLYMILEVTSFLFKEIIKVRKIDKALFMKIFHCFVEFPLVQAVYCRKFSPISRVK